MLVEKHCLIHQLLPKRAPALLVENAMVFHKCFGSAFYRNLGEKILRMISAGQTPRIAFQDHLLIVSPEVARIMVVGMTLAQVAVKIVKAQLIRPAKVGTHHAGLRPNNIVVLANPGSCVAVVLQDLAQPIKVLMRNLPRTEQERVRTYATVNRQRQYPP